MIDITITKLRKQISLKLLKQYFNNKNLNNFCNVNTDLYKK